MKDLTNNGPYPPGFKVHLRAEPESEDDEFLHWSVESVDQVSAWAMSATSAAVDPRDFFDDTASAFELNIWSFGQSEAPWLRLRGFLTQC